MVAVLDAGVHDGYDYLALEYIHGTSLRALMQGEANGTVKQLPIAVSLGIVVDVRDLPAMQAAADQAVQHFGGIDAVVANAGIASYGSVLQVDPDALKAVLDVNLLGVFHTVRAALPSIIERQGYVLIVSSLAAFAAAPGMAPYDMSKAGNEHLAHALRLEVGHLGVAVGSAHMAWIDTAMVRDTKTDLPSFAEMLTNLPWPLNKTTSIDQCADAFVKGIEAFGERIQPLMKSRSHLKMKEAV